MLVCHASKQIQKRFISSNECSDTSNALKKLATDFKNKNYLALPFWETIFFKTKINNDSAEFGFCNFRKSEQGCWNRLRTPEPISKYVLVCLGFRNFLG
jgi:hypothetical protein